MQAEQRVRLLPASTLPTQARTLGQGVKEHGCWPRNDWEQGGNNLRITKAIQRKWSGEGCRELAQK